MDCIIRNFCHPIKYESNTLLKWFEFYYLKVSGTISNCIIWTTPVCWTIICSAIVTHGSRFSLCFTSFNGWSDSLNTSFDHIYDLLHYVSHSSKKFPINTLQSFTISHSIISQSLVLLSSTMCFHRWPFI